ncbi:MAG TPA: undecaprenyl diphosphate synthase family protein [Methanoregula sp.]|nr:undecaprenyl diphosphate synthase family protein [Methanoregula sp.]
MTAKRTIKMIYRIYEYLLKRQISELPGHICFMLSGADMADAPGSLFKVTEWCNEVSKIVGRFRPGQPGIRGITFHISTAAPEEMARFLPEIRKISSIARLVLHIGDHEEAAGNGMDVVVAIGKSGRDEIAACIRRMAEDRLQPASVDEKTFESYLTFRYTPDVVVKSGGDHLTDFLIWQSVYSELFFSDVNWKFLRKVDFLRVLRDYQARIRRFGK